LRGRASDAQRKLWETVKAGQALALRRIKAGVDGMTIHNAIQELFANRGFPTEIARQARGIFFMVPVMVWDWKSTSIRVCKKYLKRSAGANGRARLVLSRVGRSALEDVVLITKTGCRILSRFPNTWRFSGRLLIGTVPCPQSSD